MANIATTLSEQRGGFDFELSKRNALLEGSGMKVPRATKTGTTIVGMVYKDGIVLGADTRSTQGPTVADKNCEKIHYIAKNIYCCGAGTAADTEFTTALIASKIELHRMATGKQPRLVTALTMLKRLLFRYQGHIGAALILGGFDCNGPSLYQVYPHGSTDYLPYVTMGSGSVNAMAIFETEYRDGMSREEAIALVHKAVLSGIYNDLGSGSNVDLCVIDKDGAKQLRNYDTPNERKFRYPGGFKYDRGTTPTLSTSFNPSIRDLVTVTPAVGGMEVDA